MIHLILFSLKRRFKNKMTMILVLILSVIFLLVGFSDKIVTFFVPDIMEPLKVEAQLFYEELLVESDSIEIVENHEVKIVEINDGFKIYSPQEISLDQRVIIDEFIHDYHLNVVLLSASEESLETVERINTINIETIIENENQQNNHEFLFVFITSIYFMMIGFAALIAQEIVGEKTTNILELIGIAIGLKTHYYSKIIIGWLAVFVQIMMGIILAGAVVLIRYLFDDGKGLLVFMNELNLIQMEFTSISEIVKYVLNHQEIVGLLLVSLGFLFMGILFIQMILVLLTTRVHTLEEAASIQSPFYIVLLIMYYVAMFLNNPDSMSGGLGYFLSFVPVTNMIFMPSRILIYNPSTFEILLSFILTLGSLVWLIKWGEKRYVETLLDFSSISQSPLFKGYK